MDKVSDEKLKSMVKKSKQHREEFRYGPEPMEVRFDGRIGEKKRKFIF